jgi:hypothetical protein
MVRINRDQADEFCRKLRAALWAGKGNLPRRCEHGARHEETDLELSTASIRRNQPLEAGASYVGVQPLRGGSNLMSLYSINDPKHWLDRAKETRALAEQMSDPEAKRTMLKNADDYERLAQRAQERAAGRWPRSK